jgi:glycerophosphoryl diester phosphodiesterase
VTFVIAHRGASRIHPPNTIEAFQAARELGADAVELDVRPSADDQLVIHHDATLPDGRPVSALRHADLPTSVPSLPEALQACEGMWVNVEIKADVTNDSGWVGHDALAEFVDSVVATVDALGDTERVLFSSFAIDVVNRCRQSGPSNVRTAFLCEAVTSDAIEMCLARHHEAIHPFVVGLTAADIDHCHDAGLSVNTWTCNDALTMDALLDWGVDGICTDVPDLLVTRVAARGTTSH